MRPEPNPLDVMLSVYGRNLVAYRLAIELGRYRAAAREALRGLRRGDDPVSWEWRFAGAWTRRNRSKGATHGHDQQG